MLASSLAWADEAVADGDGLVPVSTQAVNFGNVCANTTVTKNVLFAIVRTTNGAPQIFKGNSGAAVSVTVGTGTGLSANVPTLVSGTNFTVPANWDSAATGTISSPITSGVTFVAGAAGSTLNGTLNYTITGTAANGSGLARNVSISATATVVSCDTTPPTLNLPADQTVEATGLTGSTVVFSATASDANPASPAVTCTPPSGSTFAIGTTTVSCSATDAVGNTANGSFSITVQDTTGPAMSSPSDLTAEATSSTGATVTFTDPTATDLVDSVRPVVCVPASGSTFPLGLSNVSCTSSDTRGNISSLSFSVAVSDTGNPTLVLPGAITTEATGSAGAQVNYSASASDPVDMSVIPVCTPTTGSTFAIGTTTVQCTASDDSGNTASGSFPVTVEDTTAPAITVPSSFTAEATSAAGAHVDYSASAADLVDGAVTVSCALVSGATFPLGATTVICSAVDSTGNSSSAEFVITVVDTTAPELVLPPDVSAEADQLGGKVVSFAPTATDLVDGAVIAACLPASGSLFPVGTTIVTCSAVDAAGNDVSANLTIVITDTTAPVVTVPADVILEATGPTGAVAHFAGDVSGDDVVDGVLSTDCTPASGTTFPLGTTTVTCSATDAAGNTSDESFHVSVVDTTAPDISGTPDDFVVEATGASGAIVSYTDPVATDLVDGTVAVDCQPSSDSTFPLGTATVVTCTATDAAGNQATSTFSILVADTTAPVLTLPGPITEEATGPSGAVVTFAPTASDIVDGAVDVTCEPPSGSTFALGTVSVDCSSSDAADNTATGSFSVTVEDTTPPALTLPNGVTAEATSAAGAAVTFTATATDIVDGDVDVTCVPASGSTVALGTVSVDCTATDAASNTSSGSFEVTVQDTTAPELTLPGDITAEATSAAGAAVTFTATAADIVDGTALVTCAPPPGLFTLGVTVVECSATDAASNTASGSFEVTVQDTTAPELTLPSDITAEATSAAGAAVTFNSSSTDAVDGPGTPTCIPSSATVFALGVTHVNCSITDAAGNATDASFNVTVSDTTGPAISDTPSNLNQEATGFAGAIVTYTNPSAIDLVDGPVDVTCEPPSGSTFALDNTTPVNCTAVDARGNLSASQFSVTVNDTTAPALTVPGSFTAEATSPSGAPITFSTNATDLVDGSVGVTCVPPSGATFSLGSRVVDCTATDAHANAAHASFTITVVDTTAPTLTVPATLVTEATGPSGAQATFTTSATDIVDGPVDVSCDRTSGSTYPLGTTTVSCTATDAAGNTSHGSFTVTVQDTTAPTMQLPAAITLTATGPAGAPVTFTATATDTVDTSVSVTCTPPSGTIFAAGTHAVSCTATDDYGNTTVGGFTVTVLFDISGGFLQPVNPSALNTVKGGSTVPLKFVVRTATGGYISTLSIISGFVVTHVQCGSLTPLTDDVDFTTTGGTVLRYDTGSNQYMQNWQTPKKPGTCYRVDVVFTGGIQRLSAHFQLK